MKLSPITILPTLSRSSSSLSPTRSSSGRKSSAIGIMQAVTLSACSAAFAAMSTALLCIIILNGSSTNNLFHGNSQLARFSSLDQPRSVPKRRLYGRRSLSSGVDTKALSVQPTEGVAWLMSFPNSGTSYTIHTIRELTNTTTATNYGLEGDIKDEESVPAFSHSENGPYLELIPGRFTSTPKLFLTKTHCGGVCSSCMEPEEFIETTRSFMRSCLKSKRGVLSDSNEISRVSVFYSPNLVKKVVHIYRNPYDNVVARFHLDRKIRARKDPSWLDNYPNNQVGFQRWCTHLNEKASPIMQSSHWIDSSLAEAMENVPCVSDFYRYTNWHNLAHSTTSDLQVPSFVFHYEDYSKRFDAVTNELTEFLELDKVGEAPEFIDNKKYGNYYNAAQKHAIALFIKEFASKPTWQNVQHYLNDFLSRSDHLSSKDFVPQI